MNYPVRLLAQPRAPFPLVYRQLLAPNQLLVGVCVERQTSVYQTVLTLRRVLPTACATQLLLPTSGLTVLRAEVLGQLVSAKGGQVTMVTVRLTFAHRPFLPAWPIDGTMAVTIL